jgi:ABC-type dipeptide/oligopeptide/nickel transport system permease component
VERKKSISDLGEKSLKNWRSYLVLSIAVLLILISFVFYGVRVFETAIPAGSSPEQVAQLTRQYNLDRPIIEQYAWFLFTFLPGLTLLGIYGTVGLRRQAFPHWVVVKGLIVIMMITNTITILTFLVTAHISLADSPFAFISALLDSALALANFVYLLVIWNGHRWGIWAFAISSFVLSTLKFMGHLPVIAVLFEFSGVILLIYFLRFSWSEMV